MKITQRSLLLTIVIVTSSVGMAQNPPAKQSAWFGRFHTPAP